MRRIKALLMVFILCLSCSLACYSQGSNATSGQQPQYESYLTKYIVEFFDIGKLRESLTLINMFGTNEAKNTIAEFEKKVPVKLYLSGVFSKEVNSFWPNFFRNFACDPGMKESNRLEVIAFFMPEGGSYYKVSDSIKVFSHAVYGQEIDTLEKRINSCLRTRSYDLGSTIVRDCIIDNLKLMAQEHNEQNLCENSSVRSYVESSLNFLVDSIKGKLDEVNESINTILGNMDSNADNSLNDSVLVVIGKEIELSETESADILSNIDGLTSLQYKKELYQSIYDDFLLMISKDNICQVIKDIESERKKSTGPLFNMISAKADESLIISWMKNYLYFSYKFPKASETN